ncbi:uncharacterized protein LOC122082079 [Macadamia integrifolia]|uniref:uncharacterized protein LOC122082079 n=1 Tax=Macadamia integrifolia TaxID=60698 RepID=UPI001C4F5DCE|nr:uncharacterized protein LOC122082079 [Macadamia integrifolia]
MIFGDFNATLFDHELRGPDRLCMGAAMEFCAMVDSTSMIQVSFSGRKFTWSNNRKRCNIPTVLDKAFVNADWLSTFTNCSQQVLLKASSDHSPILVKSSKDDLEEIQRRVEEEGMSDHLFDLVDEAKNRYSKALEIHEKIWAEKSRVRWLKEGDRNSRFFSKGSKNAIRSILKEDGNVVTDQDQMGSYLVDFYKKFHRRVAVDNHFEILDVIPLVINQDDRMVHDEIPMDDEIKWLFGI